LQSVLKHILRAKIDKKKWKFRHFRTGSEMHEISQKIVKRHFNKSRKTRFRKR
jgi:hypothetical protein